MRGRIAPLALSLVFAFFLGFATTARAAESELKEGMSQGDFARWLIKAVGAEDRLPPAFIAEDAIKFLSELGVVPEGGWQKEQAVTKEFLQSLLDDEDKDKLSFEELVERVRSKVQNIFNDKKLGVFRAQASGTPSAPA